MSITAGINWGELPREFAPLRAVLERLARPGRQ
jgi:hypothetical protein